VSVTKKEKIQEIKQKIYEIYGWTIAEWAKRRGFSKWTVYDVLHGRSKGLRSKKAREILKTLEEDIRKEPVRLL